MAWTTPRTWSTGQVVTATELNTDIRDNTNYLYQTAVGCVMNVYTTTSRLCSSTSIYQNTTERAMMVHVAAMANNSTGQTIDLFAYLGSTNPPPLRTYTKIAATDFMTPTAILPFFVPPNYYYYVVMSGFGTQTQVSWIEWLM